MDTKGIETVRRDNCLLVKNLVNECLHKILIDRDVKGAIQLVKNTISDLLMNPLDLLLLVITKGVSKSGNDYKLKTAHGELAKRMREKDAATAPGVGDRVAYVIVKGFKNDKAYQKSEDPIYALKNNSSTLNIKLRKIFDPILDNARKELLQGEHMRSISTSTPSSNPFANYKQPTCIGCKAVISDANKTLCSHCKGREAELKSKTEANGMPRILSPGGALYKVSDATYYILYNRDCPVFYRRKKAEKDLGEAKLQHDRWDF